MEGQRDLHATIDTHYIPYPPTIYTTLAGYGIAERDGERRESGRRACLRIGTACDTVRSGTCMRYDVGPDGVRAYGSGRRACYGSGRRATRCGPGRRANGRDGVRYAVRLRSARANGAVRNHVRACDGAGAAGVAGRVHGFGATGGDTDLYGRLRSTSPNVVVYSWSTRQLLGHPRGLVGVSEVCRLGALILCRNQPVVFFLRRHGPLRTRTTTCRARACGDEAL